MKYAPQAAADSNLPVAPQFALPDLDGNVTKLSDFKGKWVVLEWVNHLCPYVKKHYHASHKKMQSLQNKYAQKGVIWISICSSAPGKQGYMSPADHKRTLGRLGATPAKFLLDTQGKVGRLYSAMTTPDMRIINPQGRIVYVGAIDSKRSANAADVSKSTNYVEQVLDAVLAGKPAPISSTRAYGCSVKYAR